MRDRTLSMAESGWQKRPLPEPAVKLKVHAAHPVPCTTRRRRVASRHGAGAFLFQSRQVGEPRLGRREGPNSVWGCVNSVVMRYLPDALRFGGLRFDALSLVVQRFLKGAVPLLP